MEGATYRVLCKYLNKFKGGIAWRVKKHCSIIDIHLNSDEIVTYAFAGQKNDSFWHIFNTCVVCVTNKRILIGRKGLLWGYHLSSITPDLFNDMEVQRELIWGRVIIDTVKEEVTITNLDKKALPDIETNVSNFMMKEKRRYAKKEEV